MDRGFAYRSLVDDAGTAVGGDVGVIADAERIRVVLGEVAEERLVLLALEVFALALGKLGEGLRVLVLPAPTQPTSAHAATK